MKLTVLHFATASCFALLSGCVGGPELLENLPPVPPVPEIVALKPASASTADLVKFAEGTDARVDEFDMLEFSRTFDGGIVRMQNIPGTDAGLVTYSIDGQRPIYRVNAETNPNIVVGTANYVGPLEVNYRTADTQDYRTGSGDFLVNVRLNENIAYIGGLASSHTDSIEVYADAAISRGGFTANDLTVRLRNGQGVFVRDYRGNVDGTFVKGVGGRDGAVGTVSANDNGLSLRGGFAVTEYRDK